MLLLCRAPPPAPRGRGGTRAASRTSRSKSSLSHRSGIDRTAPTAREADPADLPDLPDLPDRRLLTEPALPDGAHPHTLRCESANHRWRRGPWEIPVALCRREALLVADEYEIEGAPVDIFASDTSRRRAVLAVQHARQDSSGGQGGESRRRQAGRGMMRPVPAAGLGSSRRGQERTLLSPCGQHHTGGTTRSTK